MNGLEVRGLSVKRGGRRVVEAVSFAAPAGQWCGLIGVNGAGKTTLLRALAGRLPSEAGAVRLNGEALVSAEARAGRIAISTAPERLPGAVSFRRLAVEVARAHGAQPWPERLSPLKRALALDEIADPPIHSLSAGQKQRAAVYLSFLGAPEVVLLDEPFNALDPLIAFELKRALKGLAASGLILITALHDLPTVALHCDGGFLLSQGRLAETYDPTALAMARADPGRFEADVLERWRLAERRR